MYSVIEADPDLSQEYQGERGMGSVTLSTQDAIKVVQLENLRFTQLQEEVVLPLSPQLCSLRAIKLFKFLG